MAKRGALRHLPDAYVVARDATIRRGLRVPNAKDLIVGPWATIRGGIRSEGRVFLARDVTVQGSVRSAADVVLGAQARVEGDIESGTEVILQEGAFVAGSVVSAGSVRILGGRVLGTVTASGDIEVRPEARTLDLKAGGRIRTLPARD